MVQINVALSSWCCCWCFSWCCCWCWSSSVLCWQVYATEVGTVLLSCAFFYDIFWVFASKWFFHESVMIMYFPQVPATYSQEMIYETRDTLVTYFSSKNKFSMIRLVKMKKMIFWTLIMNDLCS
ncbi:uncharacterized protein [Spinacia oleracea]|uniref:Uncharacterized protein isoform X2 n=1 Tax=Spinacia oleracea TaxID=3562 RepID=A0ABM3RMQ7_SPIOL|nr:uncharacterized protein LOC110790337 isoform X2 [Spinacia oleracea]